MGKESFRNLLRRHKCDEFAQVSERPHGSLAGQVLGSTETLESYHKKKSEARKQFLHEEIEPLRNGLTQQFTAILKLELAKKRSEGYLDEAEHTAPIRSDISTADFFLRSPKEFKTDARIQNDQNHSTAPALYWAVPNLEY